MFCIHCGEKIRDDASFCPFCGKEVKPHPKMQEEEKNLFEERSAKRMFAEANRLEDEKNHRGKNYVTDYDRRNSTQRHTSNPNHPYYQLGGWLALVAYGSLISAVLMTLTGAWAVIRIFPYLRYVGGMITLYLFIALVLYIATLYVIIKFFRLVLDKDPDFLRFYERWIIIEAVLFGVAILFRFGDVTEHVRDLISLAIVFFIWTTYFRKSVRVRTYFGTDEYLRRSIFFKGCQAPEPAD